jgi:hypothetical protein
MNEIEKILMFISIYVVIPIAGIVYSIFIGKRLYRYIKYGECVWFHTWRDNDLEEKMENIKLGDTDEDGDIVIGDKICDKCLYKESTVIGPKYNVYNKRSKNYTRQEKRELKLRDLIK